MSGPYIPPPSAPTARLGSYMILEKHRGPFYAEGTASWDSGDESSAARERWQNSFDSNQEGCTVAQALCWFKLWPWLRGCAFTP